MQIRNYLRLRAPIGKKAERQQLSLFQLIAFVEKPLQFTAANQLLLAMNVRQLQKIDKESNENIKCTSWLFTPYYIRNYFLSFAIGFS